MLSHVGESISSQHDPISIIGYDRSLPEMKFSIGSSLISAFEDMALEEALAKLKQSVCISS